MAHRVVITGMGWITPLGDDIEGVWKRMLAGECGIGKTTIFDAETFPTQFSAEVRNFALDRYLGDKAELHKDASRNSKFALAAAQQAWDQSGLANWTTLDPTMVGIYLGGGEGPVDFFNFVEAAVKGWQSGQTKGINALDGAAWGNVGMNKLNAVCEMEQDPNMAASHLAVHFNAAGPNANTLTACAASTQAIGEASMIIRRGDASVMLSGGTHSMIHPLGVTGFNRLTALSNRNDDFMTASRPFDRTRDGFVLGEGSGMVVLESLEHAQARGATILAEIVGYGSTADAFRVTDIHEEGRGPVAAMTRAMQEAELTPADIDYISAHGTGTSENDKIETLSIKRVFGEHAPSTPISSIKSMMGHLIAAAGVVELITCVLAIRDNMVPPTINLHNSDPNCDLDYVPNNARPATVSTALSNSFGFGGQNDTLVVKAGK